MLKLIAILLTIKADEKFPDYLDLRQLSLYNLMAKMVIRMQGGQISSWVLYVILTVVPSLVVLFVINFFGFFSFLEMALWAVFLYLCLPTESIFEQLRSYIAADKAGNEQELITTAGELIGETPPTSDTMRDRAVCRSVFGETTLHVVTLFFWFVVMGIGGALFYKFNWQLAIAPSKPIRESSKLQIQVLRALGIMTWLPARVLALAYGVAGRFSPALKYALSRAKSPDGSFAANVNLVSDAGFAASGFDESTAFEIEDVKSSKKILKKAYMVLLIALAIIMIWHFF